MPNLQSLIPKIALVGCGKMGGAMVSGWLSSLSDTQIHIVEPNPASSPDDARIIWHDDDSTLPAPGQIDLFILAVKPQVMDDVAQTYLPHAKAGSGFLSIAAGRTIKSFETLFGPSTPIIRVMPNLPASVGCGASAAVANPAVTPQLKDLATNLLDAVGKTYWLDDESLIDAVTAVSGSGPAYVFLLIEAMSEVGKKLGLPPQIAEALARQTVIGSAQLAEQSDQSAAALRKAVTSPGGTTAAALEVLMADGGMMELFDKALTKARDRSRELAS